jgi:hypothetical protein
MLMTTKVKWGPSDEGYVDSHCGRFWIVPLFEGTTRAQSYQLFQQHPLTLQGQRRGTHDNQRDAKVFAQELADGKPATIGAK